jgi:hypothetical protein
MSYIEAARSGAIAEGYRVGYDDAMQCWFIVVPKRPRRPSETLYSFTTERDAWITAALIAGIKMKKK